IQTSQHQTMELKCIVTPTPIPVLQPSQHKQHQQPFINQQTIFPASSRPSPLQLRFITPPKTILTIKLKPLRLNSFSISELVFLPVIISNQLVRPTDRSSTRMFLSNLTSLTLTLNSTYSHPQLFITDEPESSPFYLNPTIWILAFLCQRAQGFTIPRICDLSKFVRKATSIMLTMTPMIHLPTFKNLS
ncbi:hypothetical protein BY996DRAFT_6444342, partial [Phakopsora pachyrhizi]